MESLMSRAEGEPDDGPALYLAGAAKAVANIRYCWLATTTEAGPLNVRPMGQTPRDVDEDEWIIRFVTDGRSRKAAEIQRAGNVSVIFQGDAEDAYLALTGSAALRTAASDDRRHWRDSYNVYFAGAEDRKNAAFIEVRVDRMELWIRGVTPEPFGVRPTTLERDAAGQWRLVA
jgi:general stress protein 26